MIRVSVDGPVATITIDSPGKRNALSEEMWRQIPRALHGLAVDDAVAALVVRGAGEHFSAGVQVADIDRVLRSASGGGDSLMVVAESALAAFPKPTIAAIDGYCIGGGWALAAACDIRVASTRAKFGVTPARLGVLYPPPSTRRLVQLVGPAVARYLLLTADLVDAQTAARWGMVSRVVEGEALSVAVNALAETITMRSQLTQQASKELIDLIVAADDGLDDRATRWEQRAIDSGEASAGVAAFLDGTAPDFRWRSGPSSGP